MGKGVAQYNAQANDLDVKAWVFIYANGVCANYYCKAPFITTTGIPYLEVHHIKRLADKGPEGKVHSFWHPASSPEPDSCPACLQLLFCWAMPRITQPQ
jgi:hypothetical protein